MLNEIGKRAKDAAAKLAVTSTEDKNRILQAMADALRENRKKILEANSEDIENGRKNGMADSLIDRLMLNDERIETGVNHIFFHPFSTQDMFVMRKNSYAEIRPLLKKQMENGKRINPSPSLKEIQQNSLELLSHFDKTYKRQVNPHIYKVSLSTKLKNLKGDLIMQAKMAEDKI